MLIVEEQGPCRWFCRPCVLDSISLLQDAGYAVYMYYRFLQQCIMIQYIYIYMPSISQVRRNTWKQRSIELDGNVGFLNTQCYAKALQLSKRCEWVQKAVLCGRILSQEEGLDVFSFSTDFEHPRRAWYEKQIKKQILLCSFFLFEFWNDSFFCFAVRFSMYSSCSCYSMLLLFQFFFLRFSHRLHWLRFSISQSWQLDSICRVVSLTMIMK